MRVVLRSMFVVIGALAMLLTGGSPAGAVGGFGDVESGEFYSEAVQWMVDNEITSGTSLGCYSPGEVTTRGQVATFMHRVAGEPGGGVEPFADVAPADYYAPAVGWMVDAGVTTGTTSTTFSPDRYLTRGELATFLHRAAGEPAGGAEQFVDVGSEDFFAEAVGWLVSEGITTGTSPTTFSPDRFVSRAEVATFLYRQAGAPSVSITNGGECTTVVDIAETQSFNLLNELRAQHGLAALVRIPTMDDDARAWSQTMDATGNFKHSNLPYGENIAWWSAGYASPEAAADVMHDLWVNSPGHFANMTRASYSTVGVGFWQSNDGGWHATHVFS